MKTEQRFPIFRGAFYAGIALAMLLTQRSSRAQVQPNSRPFSVSNYFCPDANGDFRSYRVAGFAQPSTPGVDAVLHILPTITLRRSDLKFIARNGSQFDPVVEPSKDIEAIKLTPSVERSMPTEAQIPAIAGVLEGVAVTSYKVPPMMEVNAISFTSEVSLATNNAYNERETALREQSALVTQYRSYKPQAVALNGLSISLMIDDKAVATASLSGTGTQIPSITLLHPTEYQRNRLLEGTYDLLVSYRFLDSKTSSISARFVASRAVTNFMEETQEAITRSKAAGFQIFEIGSRRSKIRTALSRSMQTDAQLDDVRGTTIVMNDATDDMVSMFEEHFFPQLPRQEVIDGHIAAAADADAVGKRDIAKIHQDYADAIRDKNELKEVDAVAAAAALTAGDYIGFIAKGVRSINSNDRRADTFRRVESNETQINNRQEWNQAKNVSVLREVSVPVELSAPVAQRPRHGIIKAAADIVYHTFKLVGNQAVAAPPETGLLLACLEKDGPAAKAGLKAGWIVKSVGQTSVTSESDLETVLDSYEPGAVVPISVVQRDPSNHTIAINKTYRVTLKKGLPR